MFKFARKLEKKYKVPCAYLNNAKGLIEKIPSKIKHHHGNLKVSKDYH